MSSLEYRDTSWGLTVAFDFATDLLRFNFTDSIWFAIARVIITSLDKVFLTPLRSIIVRVIQFRESIVIEWAASRARIRVGQLIEVTKVYEKGKKDVEGLPLSPESKQKLIGNLDAMLDKHIREILEYA